MKKLIAIAVTVVLVIAAFGMAMPTSAEPNIVYETNIVPGPWPANEVDPLDKGQVKVCSDGMVEIEIEGAVPSRTYTVGIGHWIGGSTVSWSFPGTLTTDEDGEGSYTGTLPSGTYRLLFALNYPPYATLYGHANVFISGFEIPSP